MIKYCLFRPEASHYYNCLYYLAPPKGGKWDVPPDYNLMDEEKNENDRLIYEIGYHLLPSIDEAEVPANSQKIKSIIEESKGSIVSEEMPKMTVLSYDISKSIDSKKQKFNKAYFGWVKFELEPSEVLNIKNKLENLASVLRFLIIKTVKENTMHIPKIPMFKKENNNREEKSDEHTERPKVSEAEIDKSIDNLIIN